MATGVPLTVGQDLEHEISKACVTERHNVRIIDVFDVRYLYLVAKLSLSFYRAGTTLGYITLHFGFGFHSFLIGTGEQGPSVNKEYLSQIQLYSMFGELPVLRNTVLIITVCVKVANSTFLVTNKRTKWADMQLSRYYLYNCFVR